MSKSAEVTLYGTEWCLACRAAKNHLHSQGVTFKALDIESNENAERRLLELFEGEDARVPVIDFNGEIVYGFEPDKFDEIIRRMGLAAITPFVEEQ